MSATQPLADDLLIGAVNIAKFTGHNARQIYHLHETASIPSFKIGAAICARKSELLDAFTARSRAA